MESMGKNKRKKSAPCPELVESDENFQFIAGYTEGGAPFGITWEQARLMEVKEKLRASKISEAIKNMKPINLTELIEAFDLQSDFLSFYVNLKSGEIVSVTEEEMAAIEYDDDGEPELNKAKEILDSDDYISIPSRWELNKYEIMADFVFSLEDISIQKILARAIKGKGAFGRFHTAIQAYKIENQWHEYQHDRLEEMAIDWCNLNRLVFRASQKFIELPCRSPVGE